MLLLFAAAPASAAGLAVAGVSTLVGLFAGLWAVLVARGSWLEADGTAVWVVSGAVVGTAGWAGRRLLAQRAVALWGGAVDRWSDLPPLDDSWAARSVARVARLLRGAPQADGCRPQRREPADGISKTSTSSSRAPLIHRCPDAAWPALFNRDQVLADARNCFIQLQAAWDAGDIAALRELTMPEMLADVQALLDARGHAPNHTDVLRLEAELLCIEALGSAWCASLEFSGFIRESADAAAVPFRELWMLASPQDGAVRWRLARQQALL